jgi:hypothetical protein
MLTPKFLIPVHNPDSSFAGVMSNLLNHGFGQAWGEMAIGEFTRWGGSDVVAFPGKAVQLRCNNPRPRVIKFQALLGYKRNLFPVTQVFGLIVGDGSDIDFRFEVSRPSSTFCIHARIDRPNQELAVSPGCW